MPRFLLDTDIASYIMKGSHPAVAAKLQSVAVEDVVTSAIVRSELAFGAEISPRAAQDKARLAQFLAYVQVLDFPSEAAPHYAEIRAALQKRGTVIGANDMLIAAHARSLSLTLVTNNVREFRRVPQLKVESWTGRSS